MTSSTTAMVWLGRLYFLVSVLLWPVTTIISTVFAIKMKIPALPKRSPMAAAAQK